MATKNPSQVHTPANRPTGTAPEGWVIQKMGFAPYFTPKTGESFLATPIDFDDSDPAFEGGRYLFSASADVECARGPKDNQEPVTVHQGEEFTMSGYAALSVADYFGIECHVTVGDKIPLKSNPKQSVWLFSLAVSPEDNAKLLAARQANARNRIAAARERKQLAAKSAAEA